MRRNDPADLGAPGAAPGKELADAVADVVLDQAEKSRRRAAAPSPRARRSSGGVKVAFVLLSALSLYLWFGSPSWLQPPPPAPLPALLADAGLRLEVYNNALLVEEFREREGRLPATLAEAGDPFAEVEYERLDGQRYRLAMEMDDMRVEYLSTESLDAFLGAARRFVEEGR